MIAPQVLHQQSSVSGALTLVVRNAIVRHVRSSSFGDIQVMATMACKSAAAASDNFSQSSLKHSHISFVFVCRSRRFVICDL
jgi:hypothetical protein